MGDSGNTRQIINVAAGSADSDAVNVAQLKDVAGGIKKYSITSPDNSITITPPATGDDPQNFKIKMNTTAVQDAAAWNIKEGSERGNGEQVRGGQTVTFRDTDTIDDVVREGKTLRFNANISSIRDGSGANEGKPWTTDNDNKYLAKTKNVVDAINNSGWNLQANNVSVGLINPRDKLSFDAGNRITVTPTNEANGVSHIKVAAKVDGSTITVNDQGQLVANLSGAVNTQASVEAKADNFVTVDSTAKNQNGTTRYQIGTTTAGVTVNTDTGAVTVPGTASGLTTDKAVADAIAKSGFQLKQRGEATAKSVINPGEVLNFNNGSATVATVDANGNVKYDVNVDGKTITLNNDGKLVANVPDTSKVSLTNNAGKVGDVSTADANKFVTGDNLAKTINATYWKASQGAHEETASEETTGVASSEIKPGDELTFVSGKNMALKKEGNKFVYATKDDVTFTNVTTNNFTVNKGGNVDMGGNQVHNVSTGTAPTDAVNVQ